jgi:hypothetical protein
VVEGVELAAIVVEVQVEITVVVEEGVVLRRGSLVLAPSEEKSTVVLEPPFGTNLTPTRREEADQQSDRDEPPLRKSDSR